MAGSRRIQISLPDEVYAWFTDLAIQNHTTPQQEVRRVLIEIYAHRHDKPLPPAIVDGPHLVYFVQHPETNLVKVGATSNFNRRFSQLQTEAASMLNTLGVVHFEHRDEAFAHEQAVKAMFKTLKVKGEWFQPAPYLLEFVQRQTATSMVVDGPPTDSTVTPIHSRATKSGYKGVYAYGKRWEAVIYVNGTRRRLGVYDDAETAARAYDDHLVAQAGSPNAAVNFPTATDAARAVAAPFVERFASGGKMTDIEWGQWKEASKSQNLTPLDDAPISVRPDGPRIDSSTPLIERPVKTLYRRDSVPTIPIAPPSIEDPQPAEPDEGPPEHAS